MRILYLCPSPHLGLRDRSGWSTHMKSVITGLRAQGHAVYPFVAADSSRDDRLTRRTEDLIGYGDRLMSFASQVIRSSGHQVLRRVTPPALRRARRDLAELAHDRGLYGRVLAACESFGAEAIYERTEVYHLAGARAARRLGLPYVVEVNGPLVEEREAWGKGMLFPGLARRIETAKYGAADAVVPVSGALGEHLAGVGVDPAKIHPVPNGADTLLFDPRRAHPAAVRQQFGLGRRLVVGFAGAFADWHGLESLVIAFGQVARSRVLDMHLLVVGEGPSRPALRALAQRLGLEGRVSLPGSVPHDQVPHYLAVMDICVLPASNWYMSPIKLFEYGAMGKVVIGPRTPAVAEVMSHGEEGLLVEPGCHEALARAIRHLATHPEHRVEMAAAFQQRVREQYTWEMVAGRVSRLLELSLQKRQASDAGHWALVERPQ